MGRNWKPKYTYTCPHCNWKSKRTINSKLCPRCNYYPVQKVVKGDKSTEPQE